MSEPYRVKAHAHIVIYEEIEVTVLADSIDDAHDMAADAFEKEMEEKYPWYDYNSNITTEII